MPGDNVALVSMKRRVAACRAVSMATFFGTAIFALMLSGATLAQARVLQVGTFGGQKGGFTTIQRAVDAAQPGDWVLIAPGDYHETGAPDAGVRVTKPGIHLRGMSRNGVVIDGTWPGSGTCSSDPAAQVITSSALQPI
jgi:pectin methylesterase-like acyl-CoA thioesterase